MPQRSLSEPDDAYNRTLVANVHPPDWANPKPAPRYNLVVVGGGTAGLVTAAGAAGLGAKVALIEKHRLGGDCLNVGCVPSKALIAAARVAAAARRAEEFGVEIAGEIRVDFPAVMQRMRRLRAEISPHDSAARFRQLGVDVFLGEGRFTSGETVEMAGETLRFKKAVIATGTRAGVPPIAGLSNAGYLTNETVFSLTELPARLAVIGAGPVGCELAQAFARFGSRVIQFEPHGRILSKDDPDAARIVADALIRDGVELLTDSKVVEVRGENGARTVVFEHEGARSERMVDQILIGVGRTPNVEGLNLEAAGVEYDARSGVKVDDFLQTTNRRVYAAGDVCSSYKFTHAADFLARIVIRNALFFGRARASALTIPWCTYTDPELAHVGLSEQTAAERKVPIQTFQQELATVDRARLDGEDRGFVKLHVRRGTDQIVGATIVAAHAGEMISEITLAMAGKLGLKTLADTIHPYPTQAEAIRKIGDQYHRTRLTPPVKRLLEAWLKWRR